MGTISRLFKKMTKNKPLFRHMVRRNVMVELDELASNAREVRWGSGTIKLKKDNRKTQKPVEVFQELHSKIPNMDLNNLDEKIKSIKKRKKAMEEYIGNTSTEDEDLALTYLKARKKFLKYAHLFIWEVTTEELIDQLKNKYKITTASLANFYKCVPEEGVEQLKAFTKAFHKVCDDEPRFKLLIEEESKEHKKDPILLAQSPFGNWYYVLGAWDKEIRFVDDLIYNGK